MNENLEGKWLLLIHQIPPKPGYLRVKIWRRLQAVGAVPIKNSVYVIPRTDQTLEDFQWVLKEITHAGAEGSICVATFVEGLTDDQVEGLFRAARDADYEQIGDDARVALDSAPAAGSMTEEDIASLDASLARLVKKFSAVDNLDFFEAPGRESAAGLLEKIEFRLAEARSCAVKESERPEEPELEAFRGRAWVTRKGVYVDRIASSWLIRRFIDPEASFRFVSERGYRPKAGELRFDMFEGEFTHEGGLCTFEALIRRFGLRDKALTEIAKIVSDLDLKETKFRRPETAGVSALLNGIVASHKSDEARLERGSALFDDLYEFFRRS